MKSLFIASTIVIALVGISISANAKKNTAPSISIQSEVATQATLLPLPMPNILDTSHVVGCGGPQVQICVRYGGQQFYGSPDRVIRRFPIWNYTPFTGPFENIFVHTSSTDPNEGRGFIGVINAEIDPEPGVSVRFISTDATEKYYSLSAWEAALADLD